MTVDRSIRFCLYGALLTVPLAFDPGLYHVFVLDKSVLHRLLVSAGAALWAVGMFRDGRRRWAGTSLDGPVLAVLIGAVLATAFSASPRISLVGSDARQEGLVALANDLLLFYLAFHFLKDRPRRVAGRVCLAAVVASAYGILQRLGGDPLSWSQPVWARVTSTFGQPNALGAYLGMALPLILAMGMTPQEMASGKRKRHDLLISRLPSAVSRFTASHVCRLPSAVSRLLFCAAFLLVGVALLLTGSRGGWMGAGAGLVLFAGLAWPAAARESRRAALVCAVLAVAVTGAFCLHPGLSPVRRMASTVQVERTGEGRSVAFDGTARERLVTWRASWRMFLEHPLTGVGPEMMREFLPRHLSPEDPETEADRAHNLLLHEAAVKGLIGLGALAWFLTALFRAGVRSPALAGEGRILHAGFLSAALCFVAQGLVGFGWPATTALFWVAAGMVCPDPASRSKTGSGGLRFRWVAPLLVVFSLANAGLAAAIYRADRGVAQGLRLMEAGETGAALNACRAAHRVHPFSAEVLAGLGLLHHRAFERTGDAGHLTEAEGAMARAVAMDREDGRLWAWLGGVRSARYRAERDTALALSAEHAYREAARRLPKSEGVTVNLCHLLVETGRSAEAVRVCETGVGWNPRSTELLLTLGRIHQVRGDLDGAAPAFRRVLRAAPASRPARQALGRIAFERGAFSQAAEEYRVAADLAPGNAAGWNDLGSALYRAGRYEASAGAFREALRIDPASAYAQEVLRAMEGRGIAVAGGVVASPEVANLGPEAGIDLRDPAHRRFLREGWSYTEVWGTWATGEVSEVVFGLEGVAEGALIVRATAQSRPDRPQRMEVFLNGRFLARWTFSRPAWDWETFRARVPADAFRQEANRLTFHHARHGPAALEDPRPVAVAFERIALGPP